VVIQKFNRLIRNKWVWGVFAVAISVFFAFDFLFVGNDDQGRSASSIGKLAGEDVSYDEFSAVQSQVRRESARGSMDADAIDREAWRRLGMLRAAKDLGIVATDAEVKDAIRGQSAFQTNGQFDRERYAQTLSAAGMDLREYPAYMRNVITFDKMQRILGGSAGWLSPAEVMGEFNAKTDDFTVRVVTFQDKKFSSVKVDDKALEAYYKDNTNDVMLVEGMLVKYVKVPADTPARLAKVTVTEEDIKDLYDSVKDDRFTTSGTNDTKVTRAYEEVKSVLERELRLQGSLDAIRDAFYTRLGTDAESPSPEAISNLLATVAREEKTTVVTTSRFALEGRSLKGYSVPVSMVLPECKDFVETVTKIGKDTENATSEYPSDHFGTAASSNAVYILQCFPQPARLLTFAEAKEVIRQDALEDARVKAFKAEVGKVRALAAAELAKNKKFDAKIFGDANVSTSITFSVRAMSARQSTFPDQYFVMEPTLKLEPGQISDFVSVGDPRRAIVVYLEKRAPGAVDVKVWNELRAGMMGQYAGMMGMMLSRSWVDWNLKRLNVEVSGGLDLFNTEKKDTGEAEDSAN